MTDSKTHLSQTIQNLRESHNISQDELAKYLGIKRQTVGQIEKGIRKISSDELSKISNFFSVPISSLLNSNKKTSSYDKIKSNTKFSFNQNKFENLLLYILKKCGGKPNVGETVIYKILYFIDFDSFEKFGKPLTGLNYIKLQFGPVPKKDDFDSSIQSMISNNKLKVFSHQYYNKIQKRYVALTDPDLESFSANEIQFIDKIIHRLSDMSATEISNYVHKDVPWDITPDNEFIDYNLVFERDSPYSAYDYETLFQSSAGRDVLEELGPISDEEIEYYKNLS